MPPHVPRKRLRERTPSPAAKARVQGKGKAAATQPRKPTLFDDLDDSSTFPPLGRNSTVPKQLEQLGKDDDSSLSPLSDADFEDVPVPKKQKLADPTDDEDDEDDVEFEDVRTSHTAMPEAPMPSGDLELTLNKDTRISLINPYGEKKGPSKRERMVRNATHCIHVQCLLWHNAVRNSWLCDEEVQGILISHLPPRLWEEVDRWRRNSGLDVKAGATAKKDTTSRPKRNGKGRGSGNKRSRDWGEAASRLEEGAVDMSHGDPLFRLMKSLAAWWKQRFKITAPGIRKTGYMSLERLDRRTKAFKSDEHSSEKFGERVRGLDDFRCHARQCTGSRDIGAQLFTALVRGLGLEARMVASLQPLGFGWNKLEDADPEKDGDAAPPSNKTKGKKDEDETPALAKSRNTRPTKKGTTTRPSRQHSQRTSRRNAEVGSDESDEFELAEINSDDDPVIEIPPRSPKQTPRAFDKDLEFPHYWTEVLSPVTDKFLSVDPMVKSVIATNRELIESLEPRGGKADKARQMMAYVVGFSPDGTAKEVTVRYVKRQMLPGRTKGARMPPAKMPIYDKHGKVARYEQLDWFKHAMRGYARGGRGHPITEMDEMEDSTDLKPAKPEKKEVKEGEETLQYYKQSREFVLARHLKREEALLPDAPPLRVFRSKGKGGQVGEENVYLRKDVVNVKSAETWHKQGRAPIEGEEPLKRAPYRAATTNRRREIAEAEAATGAKVLQGLYSYDQTDWIIPPPIKDGVIPKNEYGNIDLFAEHMCPEGAVHVPFRGATRVCKRLGVDFAEAVVDFEFGHRMAVPVIQGIVVAQEYHDQVMEELAKDEAERSRKEDEKRRKAALGMWRKMLMGLRIVKRIREDYGEAKEDGAIFGPSQAAAPEPREGRAADEDLAGGFLLEGYDDVEQSAGQTSGFFPVSDGDEDDGDEALVVEDDRLTQAAAQPDLTLQPRTSAGARGKQKQTAKPSPRRRRRGPPLTSEDEDDDDNGGMELDDDSEYEG